MTYKDVPVHIMEKDDSGQNLFETMFFATRAEVDQAASVRILRTHDSISNVAPSPALSTVKLDGFVNVQLFRSGIDFLTGGVSKIQIGQTRYGSAHLETLTITAQPQTPPTCSMSFRVTDPMYFPSGYEGTTGTGAFRPVDGYSTGIVPHLAIGWQLEATDSRLNTTTGAASVSATINIDRSYHHEVGYNQYAVNSFINRLEKQMVIDYTGINPDQDTFLPFSGYEGEGSWYVEFIDFESATFQIHMRQGGGTNLSQETWSMGAGEFRNIRHTYVQPVL